MVFMCSVIASAVVGVFGGLGYYEYVQNNFVAEESGLDSLFSIGFALVLFVSFLLAMFFNTSPAARMYDDKNRRISTSPASWSVNMVVGGFCYWHAYMPPSEFFEKLQHFVVVSYDIANQVISNV